MAKKEYTAIVFFDTGEAPHKYRSITNTKSLEAYCIKKLDAWYINYYNKETKQFYNRVYLKNKQK